MELGELSVYGDMVNVLEDLGFEEWFLQQTRFCSDHWCYVHTDVTSL